MMISCLFLLKKKFICTVFFLCSIFKSTILLTNETPAEKVESSSIYPTPSNFLIYEQLTELQQSDNPIVDPKDKDRVEKFLKHVMIQNRGIYTLIGSKPMAAFPLSPFIDEEEKEVIYIAQLSQLKKHVSLKKFTPSKLDTKQLWKDWKKVEKKYLGKQFLFVEYEKWKNGIFINIPAVAFVFKKYYDEFVKVVGQQFDPYTAVYKIGNSADPFWNAVEKSHYLMGLLLGYGERNARFFEWERDKKNNYLRAASVLDHGTDMNPHILNISDLIIPPFATYSLIDDQIERYKQEREKIIRLYMDKDFTELTLRILKPTINPF